MNDNPGTPRAITANASPITTNITPPQKFFAWPIFISISLWFGWNCQEGADYVSKAGPLPWCGAAASLDEPQKLCRGDVGAFALLEERRHFLVGDVEDLEALL